MKRALVLGTTLCVLWMASPAQAKRDDKDRDKEGRSSCVLVIERPTGDVRLGCRGGNQ